MVYYFTVDSKTQLLIGIFAIIVLTTATLEKFILEKKYQYLASQVNQVSYENEQKLQQMKQLYDVHQRDLQKINWLQDKKNKPLNIQKTNLKK